MGIIGTYQIILILIIIFKMFLIKKLSYLKLQILSTRRRAQKWYEKTIQVFRPGLRRDQL